MKVKDILFVINDLPDCNILSAKGLPYVEDKYVLPNDLVEFYSICGGIELYKNSDYSIRIVSPDEFMPINPLIINERAYEDISSDWYLLASDDSGQFISIDLNRKRFGRCYDSFHETHGLVGECPIIAYSFTSFLQAIIDNKGQHWFWLQNDFNQLGDAYDDL